MKDVTIRGALVLWVVIVLHIILVTNFGMMVASITNRKVTMKELNDAIDSHIEEVNNFGDVVEIYSNCNHDWEKVTESNNKVHLTLSCNKCGTIQVIDVTKEAIYINVKE